MPKAQEIDPLDIIRSRIWKKKKVGYEKSSSPNEVNIQKISLYIFLPWRVPQEAKKVYVYVGGSWDILGTC